ncbi:MAG TPA: hypothetical protein VFF64_23420 [Candidatus Eremiobacteraceae bacterium]|nr:hypothetical protein [Candidatus Eremiobacteraceae bacterium]
MRRFYPVIFFATVFISALRAQDKQFTDDWTKGASSPGSILTLKETGRNVINGHTIVSYRIFASGLPKGQHFTLWTWNLGSEPSAVADAFINPEGLIVSRLGDPKQKEDPIDIRAFAGRGERKRFALTSDDWTLQTFAEAVPFPIEQTSNGCRLSVEMSAPHYVGVIVRASGFQPNEALTIDLASGPEGRRQQATATPDGTYNAAIFPTVKGQKSGKGGVAITTPKCSVAVQFPWGEGSYKIQ